MSILGYNPFLEFRGRGTFETIGAGIDLLPDQLGFKCNFAYLNTNTSLIQKRRVDREFDRWGLQLITYLNHTQFTVNSLPYSIEVIHCTEHRCSVVLKGPLLTCQVTGNDPLKDNLMPLICQPLNNNQDPK